MMRHRLLPILLAATLATPVCAPSQPGEDGSNEPVRRERSERRRPDRGDTPRGEKPPVEAGREGRVLREFVRLRLMLRRIRQQEASVERGRTALAESEGKVENGPVVTQREIDLREELLGIERGRFVEAAKRTAAQALAKLAEVAQKQAPAEAPPAGETTPKTRLDEFRAACERITGEDSTFDSIAEELDALAETTRSEVPDALLQQRLSRLEGEADSLRERLRSIEEEIMMIRGDNMGGFWAPPPGMGPGPGADGMPPPEEMRERGMHDGRTLPPNHPGMRRRDAGKPEPLPTKP